MYYVYKSNYNGGDVRYEKYLKLVSENQIKIN